MSGPVLHLENVSKTRGSGRGASQALIEVTLAVEARELLLLTGPSGSGKTTLMAVAAGLLSPTSGRVRLSGEPLETLSQREKRALRARSVGFVYQHANLLPRLTVEENVHLAAELAGVERSAARRDAADLLRELAIDGLASRFPSELSGGEEQRASIARALVHRPGVVFADEPTASLDGAAGVAAAEALRRLAAERGAAVIVATHDDRLRPFATRTVRLVDGRLTG